MRLYELARELGIENEVALELAAELKIGLKSHSSLVEAPMVDRIRRLAESRGLRRIPTASEPSTAALSPYLEALHQLAVRLETDLVRDGKDPESNDDVTPAALALVEAAGGSAALLDELLEVWNDDSADPCGHETAFVALRLASS